MASEPFPWLGLLKGRVKGFRIICGCSREKAIKSNTKGYANTIAFIFLVVAIGALGAIGCPVRCSTHVEGLLPRETTACVNGLFIIFVFWHAEAAVAALREPSSLCGVFHCSESPRHYVQCEGNGICPFGDVGGHELPSCKHSSCVGGKETVLPFHIPAALYDPVQAPRCLGDDSLFGIRCCRTDSMVHGRSEDARKNQAVMFYLIKILYRKGLPF